MKGALRILVGHCVDALEELPEASIHACVTSPPYYRLREYHAVADWPEITYAPMPGLPTVQIPAERCELGLEDDLAAYVGHLVHVFRAVRRVLRDDGTVWLNLGDGFASVGKRGGTRSGFNERWFGKGVPGKQARTQNHVPPMNVPGGLKRKDLLGVPWRVAFALQADGWWIRSEILWSKPNVLPDPTTDRVTRAHETIFHLAKSDAYFYDSHAIREPHTMRPQRRPNGHKRRRPGMFLPEHTFSGSARDEPGIDGHPAGRNARSVWTISTTPFTDAHFAVMPKTLAERCVLASTSARGVCPACGAPYRRVVERVPKAAEPPPQMGLFAEAKPETPAPTGPVDSGRSPGSKYAEAEGFLGARERDKGRRLGQAYQDQLDQNPAVTVAWEPGCGCETGTPVAASVLDPFSGAGTTGIAALEQGRHFVGVELNAEFAEMSRRRIERDVGAGSLFASDGTVVPRR